MTSGRASITRSRSSRCPRKSGISTSITVSERLRISRITAAKRVLPPSERSSRATEVITVPVRLCRPSVLLNGRRWPTCETPPHSAVPSFAYSEPGSGARPSRQPDASPFSLGDCFQFPTSASVCAAGFK